MLKTAAALLLLTTVVVAEDSPLVALAKRTNRKASKTPVITNATLSKSSGGRISVASGDARPIPVISPAVAAVPAPQAQPTARPATSAASATVTYPDPNSPYPAASSARNIDPQVSARNIAPTSSASTSMVQSTASSSQPSSSARNIAPTSTNQPPKPK